MTERLHFHFSLSCIGEGNGTPLQCFAWRIPGTGEPGRLQSMGSLRVRHDWATSLSLFTFVHWRRKWQPTPVFCLENPRDGGAWWAAICGVAQSRTRLMWISSSSSSSRTQNNTFSKKAFLLKYGIRQGCPLSPLLFNIVLLYSHSNQTRNKKISKSEGKIKLSLYADAMKLYIQNSKISTQKLLDLINEFSKVQDTRLTFRNQLHFFIQTMK